MEKNVGTDESTMRLVAGSFIILFTLFFVDQYEIKIVLAAVSAVLAGTAFIRFCPINKLLKRNSCEVSSEEENDSESPHEDEDDAKEPDEEKDVETEENEETEKDEAEEEKETKKDKEDIDEKEGDDEEKKPSEEEAEKK